jgi:type I restriction-modification system DNA methylase subunit
MMTATLNYNERAWAIDVITEINLYASKTNQSIKKAGGEHTLSLGKANMFPDVLLFGDDQGLLVLQGWELKMPDTKVTDKEFISNAEIKARRLNLNSFLLWNVREATLYVLSGEEYQPKLHWNISTIKTRDDVFAQSTKWKKLLVQIIDKLNNFLYEGKIRPVLPETAINDNIYTDFLSTFIELQANTVQKKCLENAQFELKIDIWYEENKLEFKGLNKYQATSYTNIINWINRFLFAHYLKLFNKNAEEVDEITLSTSVKEAISSFHKITHKCDFMNVFKPSIGQEYVADGLWLALLELNMFLSGFNVQDISPKSFHNIIDSALSFSRRKLAGQFSTPQALADYLVAITVNNRAADIIDICCGTGTIAKSVFNLKIAKGQKIKDAFATTWASDKFSFPLQLCSIALADQQGMGEVVQSFKHDVLTLNTDEKLNFTEPFSGVEVTRTLPKMHAVVSNLPFVRFEDVIKLNPYIKDVQNDLLNKYSLNKKSDLYAYIIFKLKDLIEADGRLGLIVSNAWLGSLWGESFRKLLLDNFSLLKVVVSGNGKWFSNADVVTTILVLQNKKTTESSNKISFITTLKNIVDWSDDTVKEMVNSSLMAETKKDIVAISAYTKEEITKYESIGVQWSALFSNISWVASLQEFLVPVNQFFKVSRGERRGWDALFYPEKNHNIEPEFIKPVLKSSRTLGGNLLVTAEDSAFCCSKTITELKQENKTGALNWINKFELVANGNNETLPKVLRRPNLHWYEMNDANRADIVLSMNPDERLIFYRMKRQSFANQRLICFSGHQKANINICHAVLNSCVGLFLLEAIGFGRGLGALDLNATKLSKNMHILNTTLLTSEQKEAILKSFKPLLKRNTKNLIDELKTKDRASFDDTVLKAFGIKVTRTVIYASLIELYNIRQAAKK